MKLVIIFVCAGYVQLNWVIGYLLMMLEYDIMLCFGATERSITIYICIIRNIYTVGVFVVHREPSL